MIPMDKYDCHTCCGPCVPASSVIHLELDPLLILAQLVGWLVDMLAYLSN